LYLQVKDCGFGINQLASQGLSDTHIDTPYLNLKCCHSEVLSIKCGLADCCQQGL
jgi:hypothetical protein